MDEVVLQTNRSQDSEENKEFIDIEDIDAVCNDKDTDVHTKVAILADLLKEIIQSRETDSSSRGLFKNESLQYIPNQSENESLRKRIEQLEEELRATKETHVLEIEELHKQIETIPLLNKKVSSLEAERTLTPTFQTDTDSLRNRIKQLTKTLANMTTTNKNLIAQLNKKSASLQQMHDLETENFNLSNKLASSTIEISELRRAVSDREKDIYLLIEENEKLDRLISASTN